MTNEELVIEIKAGREDLCPVLWDQVRGFVVQQAIRRYAALKGMDGNEVDDLVQCGYLAMLNAVRYYDSEKGIVFLTVLGNCLKTAFAEAGGYRTERGRRDPLIGCLSLDAPIGSDPDGETFGDFVQDERDQYTEIEDRLYYEQLRQRIEESVSRLSYAQMATIYRRFVKNETFTKIGQDVRVPPERVRSWEREALQNLRKPSTGLAEYIEERTPFFMRVGVDQFQRTGTSAVEKIVFLREWLARDGLAAGYTG